MLSYTKIGCEHPVLIVSPNLMENAMKSDCYYIDGQRFVIDNEQRAMLLDCVLPSKVLKLPYISTDMINRRLENLSADDAQEYVSRLDRFCMDSFLLNSETGETYDIYQWVPCGKCSVCIKSKITSYLQRVQFSLEDSQVRALFVTLTYNNAHLPEYGHVCKRDVQLFKKRLKRNLDIFAKSQWLEDRKPSKDLKFLIVSEYGSKDGRPHYHCIITGMPYFSSFPPEQDYFENLMLRFAWRTPVRKSNGLYYSFKEFMEEYPLTYKVPADYDPYILGNINKSDCHSNLAASYTLKYMFKYYDPEYTKQFVPAGFVNRRDKKGRPLTTLDPVYDAEHKRPPFVLVSQNMGLRFVDTLFDRETLSPKFKYMSHFDRMVKETELSGYYLTKLFPSVSELIPSGLRKNYCNIVRMSEVLTSSPFVSNDVKRIVLASRMYLDKEFPYLQFEIPHYEPCKDKPKPDNGYDWYLNELNLFCHMFDRCLFYVGTINYEVVLKRIALRDKFFSKFKPRDRSQVSLSAQRFRRQMLINISKSTL